MKAYLVRESTISRHVRAKPEFFAKELDLDDEFVKNLLKFEEKWRTYQTWLRAVEAAHASNNADNLGNSLKEKPEWLEEVPEEEQPKKRASGRRSSKKSPAKRKKKASSSSTSQKKAE